MKLLAKEYRQSKINDLIEDVCQLKRKNFVIITDGVDEASKVYIKQKVKLANDIGLIPHVVDLQKYESKFTNLKDKLFDLINEMNDKKIPMIVQLPIKGLSKDEEQEILDSIDPELDIDGLSTISQGKNFLFKKSKLKSCTAKGIIDLLKFYKIPLENANVVLVGRSALIGKPLIGMFLNENSNVTILHSKTSEDKKKVFLKNADIVVLQTGKPESYSIKDFSNDAVIIDATIVRGSDGKLHGDFDSRGVETTDIAYTPVPGGVGPMTVFELMNNIVTSLKDDDIEK